MVSPLPTRSSDSLRRPGDHVLAAGKVQQWHVRWKCEAGAFGHRVSGEFRFGGLQLPRPVMNLSAIYLAVRARGVQAIPFGQKMFQAPAFLLATSSCWPIPSF